ncbi:hypothetical protein BBJ28_00005068 [Nothophytophthora sp. Chile5]|nr:hypothetical protein BBJ28_00005068 [Nothophytophthora sp. Chile5]
MLSFRSLQLLATSAKPLRRAFHASSGRLAVTTVNVPSMGDSISEGTLVEVVKQAGETVHADEVVVVLETDKVSVDVMSPVAGTIVAHLAQLEENVEVGRALFTVDDSLAPTADSRPAQTTTAAPPTPAAAAAASTSPSSSGRRVPLIKFLGKRSLLPPRPSPLSQPLASASSAPSQLASVQPSGPNVLPFSNTKRLPLSPAEVEAINSGLAFL